MNRIASEPFNSAVNQRLNVLPWLQDTTAESVWLKWGIAYRDVLILDAFNRPVARDNLTSHDLFIPANYQALKNALLQAATPVDSDKDGILDDWELTWFGSLTPGAASDADGDGFDHLQEFAFGTNPTDAASFPRLTPVIARPGGQPALAVTFPRFIGGMVDFTVQTSPDLLTWSSETAMIRASGEARMLYNGMGSAEVRFQQTATAGAQPSGFIRVLPVSRLATSSQR